jgi:CRISPR-associated protein Csh2
MTALQGAFCIAPAACRVHTYEVEGKGKKNMIKKVKREELLANHIDIKLFGILFAVGGINFKQEGPVQFGIGQSLNSLKGDTDIIRIGMTSLVPNTKNEAGISKGGSFGEKYIVRYAFIQFHGFVNNNVAKEVDLKEEEIMTMLTAMWNGTDELNTTSKFGQKSRLLIKVNYKNNGYIGDLDLMAKLEQKEELLENITQVKLKLDNLLELIVSNKDIIELALSLNAHGLNHVEAFPIFGTAIGFVPGFAFGIMR